MIVARSTEFRAGFGFTTRETEWIILALIGGLLTGYALLGKGFAYLGKPPMFIGDIVLAATIFLFLIRPDLRLLLSSRIVWCIGGFSTLCVVQTVPYLQTYGLMALRDAVVYGYALYALIIGVLMAQQNRMRALIVAFEIASFGVVVLSPLVLYMTLKHRLIQGEHVSLFSQKAGDLAVHLSGAAAFRLVGLQKRRVASSTGLHRLADVTFWACWIICTVWSASLGRGGLLTIFISITIVLALGYARRIILLSGAAVLAIGVILSALQVGAKFGGSRQISIDQLIANSLSIVSETSREGYETVDVQSLDATTHWRLNWWKVIIEDTLSSNHFWVGRGFGLNLATADGFQVDPRQSLRSPHNIHMTILARVGVPGLAAWLTFLTVLASSLVLQARRMRHFGFTKWHALNSWILTYWAATIVNGSFDVYLEGPQGGIWFWCLTGVAVAAITLEKRVGARSVAGHILPAA